eukprot:8286023-Lingulodinium_polyedra.AAC.1
MDGKWYLPAGQEEANYYALHKKDTLKTHGAAEADIADASAYAALASRARASGSAADAEAY